MTHLELSRPVYTNFQVVSTFPTRFLIPPAYFKKKISSLLSPCSPNFTLSYSFFCLVFSSMIITVYLVSDFFSSSRVRSVNSNLGCPSPLLFGALLQRFSIFMILLRLWPLHSWILRAWFLRSFSSFFILFLCLVSFSDFCSFSSPFIRMISSVNFSNFC